jgi:steroid 5-alpha reductase family enzyme
MTELITPLLPVFANSAMFIAGFFVLTLWLISLAMRDSSIVDIFWGLGSAAVAWVAWLTVGGGGTRETLVLLVATVWGVRLGLYIGIRNWGAEDRRYARLRQHVTGKGRNYALYSLRAVFGLQGLLMFLCTMPVVVAISMPSFGPPGPLVWIGFGLSATGLTVEALADWQMARFRRQRRSPGEVMDRGLWRYSRHPNYFGEMLVQWGLYLMACDTGLIGVLTIFAPALLSAMIIGPLGANLLERRLGKKNPGYQDYLRRTSAFIPWPPRQH